MAKSWLQKYATYEEEVVASAVGIVAFAGGGQANSTQLLKKFNQIDTVAVANDSVKLVPALIGKVQGVFNNTANDLTVYPATGEYIDGTINNGFTIAAGDYVEFRAYASGRWDSYAGAAAGTGTVTSVSVVTANGFAGSVATPATTPAITISTTVTGILLGNGTSVAAAVAGDFPTLNQNTTGSAATWTTGRTLSLTGDVTYTSPSFNGSANVSAAATIANDAVTYAKIQNVTTNRLLGRATAGAGDVEEIILGTNLSFTGTTLNAASAATPTLAQVLTAGRLVDALGTIQDNLGFSAIEVNTHNLFGVWTTSNSHSTPILNLTGSTSGTISIKPKAIGGTWTLTLPDNDGSAADDLFVTDGSGITSWASLSSLLPLTTRGDIMVRGAAINDRLALGAIGKILRSNGTDLVYSTATYPDVATGTGTILRADGTNWVATTNTFPNTTGLNQILYATSANVIGSSANFTLGSNLTVLSPTGGVATGIVLTQSANNGVAASSYTSIDFNVPVTGLIGQFLSTASNYSSGGLNVAGNSICLASEATSGQLALMAAGTSGFMTFNTGGFGTANERIRIIAGGNTGFGVTAPTAVLHLKAGTATANTAPLKLTAGTNLSVVENGAFEYDGTNLYFSTGGVRRTVTLV